jgi:RNase H-fold protein (predicted Holliday junction resolvase)
MKNYLAIDWGKAKIGVALAHAETRIAVPYGNWPVDEKLWSILEEVIVTEKVGTVVLGDPTTPTVRQYGGQAHPEKSFEEELLLVEQKLMTLGVTVVRMNEMFTTKMAGDARREAEKKYIQAYDDAEAARIMLADWLDLQND